MAERDKRKTILRAIRSYLTGRKYFLTVAQRYAEDLKGNDNIIGRIGEYIAINYLRRKKMTPKKVRSKSQQGYDIICKGNKKVSVKIITKENILGRTTRLTEPWDDFVLIEFDKNYKVKQIGHLTKKEFKKALKDHPGWSKKPYVKTTMLGKKGLIGKYGELTVDNHD